MFFIDRKKLPEIKRWLLNLAFRRSRLFKVNLSDCIEEFGHTYGKEGNHFFIRALRSGETKSQVVDFLREYYRKFTIKSFNETVGRNIGRKEGQMYFCPWEKGRIRPLSKFRPSHNSVSLRINCYCFLVLSADTIKNFFAA